MKKNIFSLFIFSLSFISLLAQTSFTLPEKKEIMVYSLPQTELCIEIEIEKTVQTPGVFYLYSERYLATQDVITEEKTVFRLKNISVKTNAIPDPVRTYAVPYQKNSIYNSLCVNEKGLLCGLNMSDTEDKVIKHKENKNINDKKDADIERKEPLLPLTEEYMMASSTSKMAEGAAKTIYRIRENRLSLITGDVDHLPDGVAMKQMLNEMDKMEREFTELFVGKTGSETLKHTICITPTEKMTDHVLFRVSSTRGLVSANDLSGYPYYINVIPEIVFVEEGASNKSGSNSNELFHILPAKTQVFIGDGKNTLFSETLYMPQFGQEIPLSSDVTKTKGIQITIDPETGRLLNIK